MSDDILAQLAAKISGMAPEEKAELAASVKDELEAVWRPDPRNKPQVDAYYSEADILLYGGAAGGGKTDLMVGIASTVHENSVIFRRQSIDLRGIEMRIKKLLGNQGWNGQKNYMQRPGMMIELGHLGKPGDEEDWQGRPHDFIGLDEGAQLEQSKVVFVMGWLRAAKKPDGTVIRKRVVIATNPPLGGEGEWLIQWFAPWLDPVHPLYGTVKPGELLWAVMTGDGQTIWVDGPGEYEVEGEGVILEAMSRTFIPSLLKDNPYLAGTGYEKQLMQMPEPFRSKLLKGDFMAGREDHAHQVIPAHWVDEANERHKLGKPRNQAMTAIAADIAQGGVNNTAIARLWGVWFDELIRVPGKATPDGPSIAALIIQHKRGLAEVGLDLTGGWGISARDHLKNSNIDVVPIVFSQQKGLDRTKDKKFKFGNLRSQMHWQFREALDPDTGDGIALPFDVRLKAQLTTSRFLIKGDTIWIESKEDIIKRLGAGVDEADAVIMAWYLRRFYSLSAAVRSNKKNDMNRAADPVDPDNW